MRVNGTLLGPIPIARGLSAHGVAQFIARAIGETPGVGAAEAFNSFPGVNIAHVVVNRGEDVVFADLRETVPGVVVTVPPLNFTDGIETTDEEPALAANYGDGDPDTIDLFVVDSLTSTNWGDAWVPCQPSIGATSDLRHTSFIVLSAADTPAYNSHSAAHEAGRFIMNFCGGYPDPTNLMYLVGRGDDVIGSPKRLTEAQCKTARTTSDGTLLRQE